jgi:hypothetical protein
MTWLRKRFHRKRIAFGITGAVAATLSTALFACAIGAGVSPHGATLLRLLIALPILYVGYSRYMLGETLSLERRALGRKPAELRMLGRVGLAIGVAIGLKLAIEPLLTTMLLRSSAPSLAMLSPLIGDFVYGPIATYLILRATSRSVAAIQRRDGVSLQLLNFRIATGGNVSLHQGRS